MKKRKHKKKHTILNICIFYIVMIVLIVGLLIYKKVNNKVSLPLIHKDSINTSFFLKKDNKYALFNREGNQLSDFIYPYYSEFIDGNVSLFIDGGITILNEKGNKVFEIDKTKLPSSYGGYYLSYFDNNKKTLITSSNKIIKDISSYSIEGFNNHYIVLSDNEYHYLLGFEGRELNKTKKTSDNVYLTGNNKYSLVLLEDTYYIYDVDDKLITTFESSDKYSINSLDKYTFLKNNEDDQIKLLDNNTIYDLPDICTDFNIINGNNICVSDDDYFLDENYKLGSIINEDYLYIDSSNYIKESNKKIEFIKNNNSVKTLEGFEIVKSYNDSNFINKYYKLRNIKDGLFYVYSLDGKKVFKDGFDFFEYLKDDLYLVSNDDYYLINNKGKKVSNTYKKMSYENEYFITYDGSKYDVLDSALKSIVNFNSEPDVISILDSKYAVGDVEDYKIVYNLSTREVVLKLSCDYIELLDNYIEVTIDDTTSYYSYTGKKLV